jgi:hypothetical protein
MVTPEAPVKVVKKAQISTVITASDPGTQPRMAWAMRISRCAVRDEAIRYPAKVKSGMVERLTACGPASRYTSATPPDSGVPP